MSRFYKATGGQYIDDKMFQLDTDVMMKATEKVDKDMTKVYDDALGLKEKLKIKAMESDDPEVRARYEHFNEVVDRATEAMDSDPLAYKKHLLELRGASRELQTDLSTGVLGSAQTQYEAFDTYSKSLDSNTKISGERRDL